MKASQVFNANAKPPFSESQPRVAFAVASPPAAVKVVYPLNQSFQRPQ